MTLKAPLLTIAFAVVLVGLIAGAALTVGLTQYRAINGQMAAQVLDSAQAVERYLQAQRIRRIEDISKAIASDPTLTDLLAQALAANETAGVPTGIAPIRDLLEVRRRESGLIAVSILDPAGKELAKALDPSFSGRNWLELPSVAQARKDSTAVSGFVADNDRVFLLTATPLLQGGTPRALLLAATPIDEPALRDMTRIAQADFALLTRTPDGPRLVASTLGARDAHQLETQLAGWSDEALAATSTDFVPVQIGEHRWSTRIAPLHRSTDKAALLTLVPAARRDMLEGAIELPLAIVAIGAILLVLLLLVVVWRGAVSPLMAMDALAARAAHGDHALQLRARGFGPIRRIAASCNQLLQELDRYRVPPGVPRRRATDRR